MGRNLQTFDVGNRAGAKLTPELREQFVSIVAQTGRISVASGKCGLGVSTARHWMARGRQEESGVYREFLDAVERARSDFLLFANRQLNRLATGGLVRMPSFDKSGSPIRNHKPTCGAAPGYPCDCNLVFVEKVVMPNPNVLMWQVDRLDPLPNGDAAASDVSERMPLSDAEQLEETRKGYDLLVEAVKILVDLGVPLEQLLPPESTPAIETTSTAAPAEPEPAKVVSGDLGDPAATASDPPKPDPEPF